MGIKHHLLAFPWVANHKTLAAVRQTEMRDFDGGDDTINLNTFLTPVELTRLTGRKGKCVEVTLIMSQASISG